MYISEALTRTYAVAGRLPDPVATRGPGTADPVPALSIAAWRAITAITAVAGAAGRLLRVFRRQRTHRATARSLRALDDRTLADIGLPRNAIDAVAGALTRDPAQVAWRTLKKNR